MIEKLNASLRSWMSEVEIHSILHLASEIMQWGSLINGPWILGLFRSAIGTGAAMARIDTTVTSPELTPVLEPGTDAPCTSWIPGRWAGPATRDGQWSYERAIFTYYCVILLCVSNFCCFKVYCNILRGIIIVALSLLYQGNKNKQRHSPLIQGN
jgi:hypothetical protein